MKHMSKLFLLLPTALLVASCNLLPVSSEPSSNSGPITSASGNPTSNSSTDHTEKDDKDTMISDLNGLKVASNYTILTEPNMDSNVTYSYASLIERAGNLMHTYAVMYDPQTGVEKPASDIYYRYEKEEGNCYYYYLNLYTGSTKWDVQVYSLEDNPSFAELFEGENPSYSIFFNHFINSLTDDSYEYSDGLYIFPDFNYGEGNYVTTMVDLTLKKENGDFIMTYAGISGGQKYSYTLRVTGLGTTSITLPDFSANQ